MWDLMRGRGAASLALGVGKCIPRHLRESHADQKSVEIPEAEIVKFSEDGKHFAILTPQGIDVYTTVSDQSVSRIHNLTSRPVTSA